MLALWERSPRSLGELADELAMEPATLSPLVKRLEAQGTGRRRGAPTTSACSTSASPSRARRCANKRSRFRGRSWRASGWMPPSRGAARGRSPRSRREARRVTGARTSGLVPFWTCGHSLGESRNGVLGSGERCVRDDAAQHRRPHRSEQRKPPCASRSHQTAGPRHGPPSRRPRRLALALAGVASRPRRRPRPPTPPRRRRPTSVEINLVTINDFHGRIEASAPPPADRARSRRRSSSSARRTRTPSSPPRAT